MSTGEFPAIEQPLEIPETRARTLRERLTETRLGRAAVRAITALTIFSAAGGGAVAESTPAHADASGCTLWGGEEIPVIDVTIDTGEYCFGVKGNGTQVDWTDGSFNTTFITDWTEIVRFYDGYGNNYATFNEPVTPNSYGFNYWTTHIHGTAKLGRVCGTLLTEGVEIATACEGIE